MKQLRFVQFFAVSPLFGTADILAVLFWTLPSWQISWSLVFAWDLGQTVPRIPRLSVLVKSVGSDQFFTGFFWGRLSNVFSGYLVLYMFLTIYLPFSFFFRIFGGKLLSLAFPLVRRCSIGTSEEIQKLWDLKCKTQRRMRSSVQEFSIFFVSSYMLIVFCICSLWCQRCSNKRLNPGLLIHVL